MVDKGDQTVPRKWELGGYLVYHVDKGLSIVPTEVSDHLDLILTPQD